MGSFCPQSIIKQKKFNTCNVVATTSSWEGGGLHAVNEQLSLTNLPAKQLAETISL